MRRTLVPLVVIALLLPIVPAAAQTVSWTDQFGTRGSDRPWGVVSNGTDVYVVGETDGPLGGPTIGGQDAFLRRYTADGERMWTAHFGGEGVDIAFGVAVDATGVYVVGQTDQDASDRDPSDGFIAKYDADGNRLWFRTVATRAADELTSVVVDGDGVDVVGFTDGRLAGQERIGAWDALLVRFDEDGTQEWATRLGTPGFDFGESVAVTPFGIAVGGYTYGELEGGRRGAGGDGFAALFDAEGDQIWIRGYGTPGTEYAYGLASDATGIYVSGLTYGRFAGQEHVGDDFYPDSYVRKISAVDGSRVWVRQFGTKRGDDAMAVAVHGDEVVVGGSVAGTFPGQTRIGRTDAYLRSLDAETGEDRWTFQFGSSGHDAVHQMALDGDVAYLVGDTRGAFPGETWSGREDAFIASIALDP